MKYAVIIAIVLGGFYIGAMQLVLNQINDLKYTYQNADVIAQKIVANTSNK